jgi:hypothetical protein
MYMKLGTLFCKSVLDALLVKEYSGITVQDLSFHILACAGIYSLCGYHSSDIVHPAVLRVQTS